MARIFIFISLLLLFSGRTFAQGNTFTITGTVIDSAAKEVVELANVALKKPGSDVILTGATADLDGNFVIQNIKPGKYVLNVAFVGYMTKIIPLDVRSNIKLGKILLSTSVKTIEAAVIVAKRPDITVDAEKTVFNVSQSPSSQIGLADDLLREIPGVSVDQDGNISIAGKQGVKVLVDGRPNAMADNDLQGFLKSIPANSIERIEVINNPSEKYDADGNAGIINIVLKKGRANGLNITASLGYGILNRYNGNVNMNYRKNKFNVFANYSANASKMNFTSISHRTLSVNDTTSYYNYTGNGYQRRFSNTVRGGFDYFFTDYATLTYTASLNYSHGNNFTGSNSASLDATGQTIDTYKATNPVLNTNYTVSNSLAYVNKYDDSTGRELDLNISHSYTSTVNNTMLNSLAYDSNGNFSPANSLDQQTYSSNGLQNIMLKADYVYPIPRWKGYRIEMGAKNETTFNANTFNDYNVSNNSEQYDSLLSNKFKYVQNIAAAYGLMRGAYQKWLTYTGGLRLEHTYINGNYNSINKDYLSFFPNATVATAFNDTQNLSLTYNRRIQRPPFRFINSAITYTDQFTTWQGNPLLQPSYSNNISLAYSHSFNKQLFVFRAGGTFVDNGFTNITSVDSNRIAHGTEVNGANSRACNFSLYTKLHITKWWEAQAYYNFSYTYYGFTEGLNLGSTSGGTNNLWGLLRFTFWTNTTLDISGWFNTHNVTPQGGTLPVGAMYASIKKAFLNDHLTVSLAGNDILNSMKWRWTQENTGIESNGSWQGVNRCLMITLTYRFSSHDFEDKKEREEHDHTDEEGGKG